MMQFFGSYEGPDGGLIAPEVLKTRKKSWKIRTRINLPNFITKAEIEVFGAVLSDELSAANDNEIGGHV